MKLFLDTCTIVDYLCDRKNSSVVESILDLVDDRQLECCISVGSFYTLAYLIEHHLKQTGFVDKEQRIEKLREMLTNVLHSFSIADIFSEDLLDAVEDKNFTDLEDSCQFQAALKAKCDYLITINVSDFKDADMSVVKVLTPQDFIAQFTT